MLRPWILAARPRTLPAAVAPVVMGGALACGAPGSVSPALLALILACALAIQIGTNYANDYFDFVKGTDTPDRVGPTRATAAGWVRPRAMLAATILSFGLAALGGLLLVRAGGWPILLIGLAAIACGILYTAGPWPLGYLGLGDLFVLLFFGPIPVAGTAYLLTGAWDPRAWIAGLGPGLLSTALLAINNYRDRHTDRAAGKRSLVVRFGDRFGAAEVIACLVTACHVPLLLIVLSRGHLGLLLVLLTAWPTARLIGDFVAAREPSVYNVLLGRTGRLLVLHAALFSLGWLL